MKTDLGLSIKVVLLGDSCVGKTALMNRWTHGTFLEETKATVAGSNQQKFVTVDNHKINISLWDTAGQEQFRSLAPIYTRSAACAMIVTSCFDLTSFESIESWINTLKETEIELPPLVLIVNKMDLLESNDDEGLYAAVENVKDKFASVFYVSARTGEHVDEAFEFAAKSAFHFLVVKQDKNDAASFDLKHGNEGSCC